MHQDVLTLILGGGRGTRLYPLTMLRSKPAVPIAGKYRLIDIPISNCINSGCNRVYVLTQFLSVSLHRHIANTYKFDPFSRGFVEILAAQQTNESVRLVSGHGRRRPAEHPLRSRGSVPGRADPVRRSALPHGLSRSCCKTHRDSRADVTIAVLPVAAEADVRLRHHAARRYGPGDRLSSRSRRRRSNWPRCKTPADWIEAARRSVPRAGNYLASMGIYLFQRDALFHLLNAPPPATDFGKEVFPRSIQTASRPGPPLRRLLGRRRHHQVVSRSQPGPVPADDPPFDFHAPEGVIYTRMRYLPASRIDAAKLEHCLISDGCVVGSGSSINRCVLGVRTQIGRNASVRNTVLIGADRFETAAEKAREPSNAACPTSASATAPSSKTPSSTRTPASAPTSASSTRTGVQDAEGPNFVIRDGIVVIPKGSVLLDGTVI